MWAMIAGLLAVAGPSLSAACSPSATTVSGSYAPGQVCAGELIFSDDFNDFDLNKWQHEITLGGGGNWEFQYYNNDRKNSFTDNGVLYIRPSKLSDEYGEAFLTSGTLDLENDPNNKCTNSLWWGCKRTGTPSIVLNPIKSARIRTLNSFSFQYGKVEVRAKMPAGDWLWPAIWLLPTEEVYGYWPTSGEIDMVESRGNRDLTINGGHIGTHEAASTLHYGPKGANGWDRAHWTKNNDQGYNADFHRYQLEWTPDFIKFSIDDAEIGRVAPDDGGFWKHGGFTGDNPWANKSKMAPFDQKFHLIMNLAVGGTTGYFPENVNNPSPKPWVNGSPTAITEFWNARGAWEPTWNLGQNDGRDASLQVDYVRIWAL